MDGDTLNEGGQQPTEGAPEIASRNLIVPAEGMTIPGIPAAPGQKGEDIVTAGNRSGDGAITRNNIDAILSNPAGPAKAEAKGDGIAAVTGTLGAASIDEAEKAMTGFDGSIQLQWTPSTDNTSVTGYRISRDQKPGEPVNGAFGGGADSLADADGKLLEPAAESRFGRGLQTGGEHWAGFPRTVSR